MVVKGMKPLSNRQLADGLGVAPARISEWTRRGMPTSSVDAARYWRNSHAPARRKRALWHPDAPYTPAVPEPAPVNIAPDKLTNEQLDDIVLVSTSGDEDFDRELATYDREEKRAVLRIIARTGFYTG